MKKGHQGFVNIYVQYTIELENGSMYKRMRLCCWRFFVIFGEKEEAHTMSTATGALEALRTCKLQRNRSHEGVLLSLSSDGVKNQEEIPHTAAQNDKFYSVLFILSDTVC